MRYAGFWVRFWASIIDSICLIPVWGVQLVMQADGMYGFSLLIGIICYGCYYTLFESGGWQATPGKKLMGLIVVDIDGRRISFGKSVGRYLGKTLSSLLFGIGYVMVGITDRKQGLHDKLAGTYVLRGKVGQDFLPQSMDDRGATQVFNQKDEDFSCSSSSKIVMAGFDTAGHVVRLTFDMQNSKLNSTGLVVGRNSEFSDLQISDPSVSRKHARLFTKGLDLFIEDLESTNGVFVNGMRLYGTPVFLPHDSKVIFGQVELSVGRY